MWMLGVLELRLKAGPHSSRELLRMFGPHCGYLREKKMDANTPKVTLRTCIHGTNSVWDEMEALSLSA